MRGDQTIAVGIDTEMSVHVSGVGWGNLGVGGLGGSPMSEMSHWQTCWQITNWQVKSQVNDLQILTDLSELQVKSQVNSLLIVVVCLR